jgi:hypothetical protein
MGFGFVCLWTITSVFGTSYDYISARHALASGHYSIVQGPITDFKPVLPGRTGDETFTVQGKTFSYSEYERIAGFNRTKREGNQLDDGVKVRVTYAKDEISGLEVAQ